LRPHGAPGDDPGAIDLDACRERADPSADAAVSAYFATVRSVDPDDLFVRLVRHVRLPPEDQVPAVRAFFESASVRPAWVDDALVDRGQAFFDRLVTHHFSALYFASLPNAYGAAQGVQVLRLTGRLRTDTQRRLNETAQFLMDVTAPGALGPGGAGIDRILHVRLMHAAVRWLIEHDPAVSVVDELPPPPPGERDAPFVWSRSWGLPGNQEDLVGTWLTFTTVVYDAFDASGVDVHAADIDAHLHMWRLIAHHLGIEPELVPLDRASAAALRDRIWARQQAPSAAGHEMAAALLAQAHQRMPRFAWPILPTTFRHFLGDAAADRLGLPAANWTRHLFPVMAAVSRLATRGQETHRWHARVSAFMGRHLMDGLLAEMRHGERPPFSIPTHLAADAHAAPTTSVR
jgi:hypothetical protein